MKESFPAPIGISRRQKLTLATNVPRSLAAGHGGQEMPQRLEGDYGRSAAWGVVTLALSGVATATWLGALSSGPIFLVWPAFLFTGLTIAAICRCFAFLPGRRATSRDPMRRDRRGVVSTLPSHPINVALIPEQVGDRLHLGFLNRGAVGHFSVQVTGILNAQERAIGSQHWPIPWLDHSTDPKRILPGETRMLDFARYDVAAVNTELSTGHGGANHWFFSSVPDPVGVTYYKLRDERDLAEQRFLVTVRILDASSGSYTDRKLTVGACGFILICEPDKNEAV
jgi:hypothetical protein